MPASVISTVQDTAQSSKNEWQLIRLLAVSLFISGCSSVPNLHEHRLVLSNFRYRNHIDDEWLVYDRIDQPFSGDCEDYAFTLQRQICGEVWHVELPDSRRHVVLLANGYVYDNLNKWPIAQSEFQGRLWFVMRYSGVNPLDHD